MGKKQILIIEYDVKSAVLDVRYFGLSLRSEAKKILIKTHQNLMKSLLGGGFEPELIFEEEETENGEAESGAKPEPESE